LLRHGFSIAGDAPERTRAMSRKSRRPRKRSAAAAPPVETAPPQASVAAPRFETRVPPPDSRPALAVAFGLPLLIAVLYLDVSDLLMRRASLPSLLQILIVVLSLAVVIWRRALRPATAALQPVVLFLCVYALVVFSTSVWAADARLVDERVAEIIKAILIAVLAASLTPSRSALQRAMTALIAAATLLAATSVVQIATGRFLDAFGGLVSPQAGTMYEHRMGLRAAGPPNSDPNFYARILLIVIPLAIAYALVERRLGRRLAYAAAAAVIVAGTLVTYSRGAMLAMGVMALLVFITLRVRARLMALAAVAAAIVLVLLPADITQRFLTIETLMPGYAETQVDYDSSVEKRKLLVASAVAMFEAHPLAGVGAGHYGRSYPRFANEIGSAWIDYHPAGTREHPHGLYFELASETGVLGLLSFGAVIAAALLSLERSRRTFTARSDRELALVTTTVSIAIASYLVASVFLHETHLRYLAVYLGFAIALARMARGEVTAT
jgi:O-antigen ligase